MVVVTLNSTAFSIALSVGSLNLEFSERVVDERPREEAVMA